MAEIVLAGCAPTPLASYLKALGIFRLVAEQKDKGVKACWRDEAFVLDTHLTNEELVRFFLDEYRPSPIISPWNAGSGFYFQEGKTDKRNPETNKKIKTGVRDQSTTATKILARFAETQSTDRLADYKRVIRQTQQALCGAHFVAAPTDDKKRALVMHLRARLPDDCLAWLDAAVALEGETLGFPPLLGSGGNDGNLDFSSNFMQRLADVIGPATGNPRQGAEPPLQSALFGSVTTTTGDGAIGQFAPGAAGGPNATTGFERKSLINAWDYILMVEGALLFAASATRRLGATDAGAVSYPFTVRTTGTAGAGAMVSDEGKARGEIWLPLWPRSAAMPEILALFSEGRATLGRGPAQDGLDFARATATLGVNRGIAAFQRFGFLQRLGKNYVAAPMSRVRVQYNEKADLLNDLDRDAWLQSFRRFARDEKAPARLQSLVWRLDAAVFAMTQDASPRAVQRVLIAVGEAAAYLASSPKARDPKEGKQNPPPRLRSAWFHEANDGSPEFRIAAALAGLGKVRAASATDDRATPPPLRAHLAPLDEKSWYQPFGKWSDRSALAVWGGGTLERNLAAVIERRPLFAAQRNLDGGPFDAHAPTDLASVLSFLAGGTDDARIAALAQGLAWGTAPNALDSVDGPNNPHPLPLAYALLKPFFAPIEHIPKDIRLPVPPGLVARLRAGDVGAAVALACRRARASGLPVTFAPPAAQVASVDGPRLLASLLIPIRENALKRVLQRAYPALFDNTNIPTEDPADEA